MPIQKGRKEVVEEDEGSPDLSSIPKAALAALRAVSREEVASELKRRAEKKHAPVGIWDWLTADESEEDDDE